MKYAKTIRVLKLAFITTHITSAQTTIVLKVYSIVNMLSYWLFCDKFKYPSKVMQKSVNMG